MRSGPTIVSVSQRLRTKWRRADSGGGRRSRDPRDGKGSLVSLLLRRLTPLPRGPGRGPVLGPCFRKSRPTPLHRAEERETTLCQGRRGLFPIRAGPDSQSARWWGSTAEGVPPREWPFPLGPAERRWGLGWTSWLATSCRKREKSASGAGAGESWWRGMLPSSGFCWSVFLTPASYGYESKLSPQCGTQRAVKWLWCLFSKSLRNLVYGSLVLYFCAIPSLGPVLLKVGGECICYIRESLRTSETDLSLFEVNTNERGIVPQDLWWS